MGIKVQPDARIRPMQPRDLTEVMEIERFSFSHPWDEYEVIRFGKPKNAARVVAVWDGVILGYLFYEIHVDRLHVRHMAVHDHARRCGIGSELLEWLGQLSIENGTRRVLAEVSEFDKDALWFFNACQFRALSLLREFYGEGHDAYLMQWKPKQNVPIRNRVSLEKLVMMKTDD